MTTTAPACARCSHPADAHSPLAGCLTAKAHDLFTNVYCPCPAYISPTDLPVTPYAGSSGWSGSDTSAERAEREDRDGTTKARQQAVLTALHATGPQGLTWRELAAAQGWHHGQASGALSALHKAGRITRLAEVRRDRCAVYVLPEHTNDRPTAHHGRKSPHPAPGAALSLIIETLAAQVDRARQSPGTDPAKVATGVREAALDLHRALGFSA